MEKDNDKKMPRYRPKPKDGTLVEKRPDDPEANWFGPSIEPQEEYINEGVRADNRENTERRTHGQVKHQVESTKEPET